MSTHSNLIGRGAAMLTRHRGVVSTETVEWWRGGSEVEDGIEVTFSAAKLELMTADGLGLQWDGDNIHFAAADLVIDGETTTPKRGDKIVRTLGVETLTYEVQHPAPSMQCWNWSDSQHVNAVAHVKRVAN